MAGGVAGRLDDVDGMIAELEAIAVAIGAVETGNGNGLTDRADDLAAELLLQCQIGVDMVGVVMGGEDMGDRPAAALGSRQNRAGLRASIEAV